MKAVRAAASLTVQVVVKRKTSIWPQIFFCFCEMLAARCEMSESVYSLLMLLHPCGFLSQKPSQMLKGKSDFQPHVFPSTFVLFLLSETPVLFKQELQNEEAKEGKQVRLTCELSKPGTPVKWMKGDTVLYASEKYEFKQHGTVAELIIRDVKSVDAGDYTCSAGELKTTARVKVNGGYNLRRCPT